MIFGNIKDEKRYSFLGPAVRKCFEYYNAEDLLGREKGSYPIDGDNIFVNIVEYETVDRSQKKWEAHKDYLDIHMILSGEEIIDVNFIDNMTQGDYVKAEDFLAVEGEVTSYGICRPGDFMICYPEDGHKPGVKVDAPQKIKKAIFKVRV